MPEPYELQNILNLLDVRARAFCAIMKDSGIRPIELTRLKRCDVHFDEYPPRIFLHGDITKNGESRTTYLTPEATKACQDYYKIRDSVIDGPDERYFPFRVADFQYALNDAVRKLGLDEKDSSTDRLKLHLYYIKKFFDTRLCRDGMPEYAVRKLMGHEGYMSDPYIRDEDIKELYNKHMKVLFVYEATEAILSSKDNQDLRKQLDDLQRKYESLENAWSDFMDEVKSGRFKL